MKLEELADCAVLSGNSFHEATAARARFVRVNYTEAWRKKESRKILSKNTSSGATLEKNSPSPPSRSLSLSLFSPSFQTCLRRLSAACVIWLNSPDALVQFYRDVSLPFRAAYAKMPRGMRARYHVDADVTWRYARIRPCRAQFSECINWRRAKVRADSSHSLSQIRVSRVRGRTMTLHANACLRAGTYHSSGRVK